MRPIILASASPRRAQLLKMAGISFQQIVRQHDEPVLNVPLEQLPEALAAHKAQYYEDLAQQTIVLTADTIVILNHKKIGKPQNETEAIQLLEQLNGKMHQVITGVCLCYQQKRYVFSEETKVHFHKVPHHWIVHYVRNYSPLDKAGAYGIQEWWGAVAIQRIEGDFFNVMGLPIAKVVQELSKLGYDFP